ncbi:hypothetical protein [Frankia sp. AgKG'84/4]|uniref:hypothetical protein n=1 Tax=Frankia sp. AgKG'84/4 TaxID=573490 RepID=UPI00200CE440|nr:hypothetical protein [Frankia sp. AgKG'84/4]MCL9793648.1 hypothetical protein [Frankia sp. AgKG'84/4]
MRDWHSWAAVAIFVLAYAAIISERIPRTTAALGGAAGMLAVAASDDKAEFTRYGLIITVVTVALSAVYLWLRYLAFT